MNVGNVSESRISAGNEFHNCGRQTVEKERKAWNSDGEISNDCLSSTRDWK